MSGRSKKKPVSGRWNAEQRGFPIYGGADQSDALSKLMRERMDRTIAARSPEEQERLKAGSTVPEQILFSTRWVIFQSDDDGKDELSHISYTFDVATAELVLAPNWLVGGFEDDDELTLSIVRIHLAGVPIIAETDERQARLDSLFRTAITTGFYAKFGEDDRRRIRYLPEGKDVDRSDPLALTELAKNHFPSTSETRLALKVLKDELEARDEAGRVLASLRLAITALSEALHADTANEAALQRTLTVHPILFGPEYIRVQPEFPLGSDYRADYALVRGSGLVDLMEIEASTHPLYVKKGKDPSAALTHAEQQVMDWLDLYGRATTYLQDKTPGLRRPRGFVVIGRRASLTPESARKLEQRNRIYESVLEVLTYDDLLDRAKGLLEVFEGLAPGNGG